MNYRRAPLHHEWSFPVPNGREQYEQYTKLVRVAAQLHDFGIRVDRKRALASIVASTKRAELFTGLFLDATKLDRDALGAKGSGGTKAVKEWFKDQGAPDVVFDKRTKEPQFNAAALMC